MEAQTTPAATPEKPPPAKLAMKLAQVMAEVDRIPKNGVNQSQNYKYALEADILEGVRGSLSKRSLVMMPSVEHQSWESMTTKSGSIQKICTLTVRFTIIDGETGESYSFVILGQGQDVGDKATYKAMTGATKYALMKLFLIPTGDDPENDHHQQQSRGRRQAPQQQAARDSRAPTQPQSQPPVQPSKEDLAAQLHKRRIARIFHELQAVRGWMTEEVRAWVDETVRGKPSNQWSDQEVTEIERRINAEPKS